MKLLTLFEKTSSNQQHLDREDVSCFLTDVSIRRHDEKIGKIFRSFFTQNDAIHHNKEKTLQKIILLINLEKRHTFCKA
jgi:hypothetical protein